MLTIKQNVCFIKTCITNHKFPQQRFYILMIKLSSYAKQKYPDARKDIFDDEYFQPLQEFNYTEMQVLELLNWNVYENVLETI